MITKLDIGDKVNINNKTYTIRKMIINSHDRIRYLVGEIIFPRIGHLCDDEFTEIDFENGTVKKEE